MSVLAENLALIEAMEAQQDWAALEEFLPTAYAQRAGNALLEPFCDRARVSRTRPAADPTPRVNA